MKREAVVLQVHWVLLARRGPGGIQAYQEVPVPSVCKAHLVLRGRGVHQGSLGQRAEGGRGVQRVHLGNQGLRAPRESRGKVERKGSLGS